MKNQMRKTFIIALLFALIIIAGCEEKPPEVVRPSGSATNTVDFSRMESSITMAYGINENDNWEGFEESGEIKEYHKDIATEYIRVWATDEDWTQNTIPFNDDWDFDFTHLDKFIDATLDSDSIPFVVFAEAPPQMTSGDREPPWEDAHFAHYVRGIVEHYKYQCENNLMSRPCDINDWYFEIWNEPWEGVWWWDYPPRYSTLYNEAYYEIKDVAPNAKVGGFVLPYYDAYEDKLNAFLDNSPVDFVSVHSYGNIQADGMTNDEKMVAAKDLLFVSIKELREEMDDRGLDAEIVNSEYSSDWTPEFMDYLDEEFTLAWYANALIYQIKSGVVDMELFYAGTTVYPDTGYGMWSTQGGLKLWPIYYMKKNFVETNPTGSKVVYSTDNDGVNILGTTNTKGNFVTIVNQYDETKVVDICVKNAGSKLKEIDSGKTYSLKSCKTDIALKPYEVKFFKVI